MSNYQVLALKWRPHNFVELVGQEHVLKTLSNALVQGRIHHAYLLSGTRGVGKTTLARIIAKCLNCEQGQTPTPCGTCYSCKLIDEGRYPDLLEIDAASRTKVEDTREILDNVQYAPSHGRYKIYLIDEVHMLSGHSFNALLKTLEEPPPHVKFLLATTDPQRLPITILSRCVQFHLKNLVPEVIAKHLEHVLTQENISFEAAALNLIARAAAGSMRDALSLLDQAIAYSAGNVTSADVAAMIGAIDQQQIVALLHALSQHDASSLLTISANLAEQGADFANVLEELLTCLHQIAVTQKIEQNNFYNADVLRDFAKIFSQEDLQLYYQIALLGRRDLALAPSTQIGFEMVLLRLLAFSPASPSLTPPTLTLPHASRGEEKTAPSSHASQVERKTVPSSHETDGDETVPTPREAWGVGGVKLEELDWPTIAPQLKITGMGQALVNHSKLKEITADTMHLLLDPSQKAFLNSARVQQIETALAQFINKPLKLLMTVSAEPLHNTLAQQQQQIVEQKQQERVKVINSDPNMQKLLHDFNGTLITDSLTNEE